MKKQDEYRTTRVWVTTHQRLRMIAALSNKSIVQMLDDLTKAELVRMQKEKGVYERITGL